MGTSMDMSHEDNYRTREPAYFGASPDYFIVPVHPGLQWFLRMEPEFTPVEEYTTYKSWLKNEIGQLGRMVFVLKEDQ